MFESLHYGTMISTNSSLMSKNEILGIIMIITNRLTIRPIEENDWTAIKEIWDDFKNTEFVIYDNYKDTSPESLQPRVAKWEEANLKNSYISFLCDSISTYYSYTPFTNEENSCYYPKYHELTVEQTWWMMTRNQLGCKLGINNSYSGTCVMNKYGKNSTENISRLEKSRRLDNLPPDIMVVFMGMNDSLAEGVGVAPSDFKTSYRNMINNIYKLYPDVKLFLCTISFEVNRNSQSYYEEHVKNTAALNQVIIDLSVEYNLPLIDFRNAFNTRDYLADTVHPNVLGMAELAKVAVSTIREYFDNLENN